MQRVFIFDMDGVLIDSVNLMYDVYAGFLSEFGITGTQAEFSAKINGPKIEDIVVILKNIYNLPETPQQLFVRYDQRMKAAYAAAPVTPGVKETMQLLKQRGYGIAVASSSKKENILFILEKHGLRQYVDAIASGDDVPHAKPAPDIYLLVRKLLPGISYLVLEDSDNGMRAATGAGMEVIFFNGEKRKSTINHAHEVKIMPELEHILDENRSPFVGRAGTITFHEQNKPLNLKPEQELVVEQCWKDAQTRNPTIFDGKIVSYAGHAQDNSTLRIDYFITSYKYELAQLNNPHIHLGIFPLAVSGMIVDPQKNTLLGRRAETVTQYSGRYELAPSGGISADKTAQGTILFKEQLAQEFGEEIGMSPSCIESITPLGLVFEKDYGVYVIANIITIHEPLAAPPLRKEYSAWKVLPCADVPAFLRKNPAVPTSTTIAQAVLASNP